MKVFYKLAVLFGQSNQKSHFLLLSALIEESRPEVDDT
jgi:hypothetical protein